MVGVLDQRTRSQSPLAERHLERLEGELGSQLVYQSPADHLAGMSIEQHRQIQRAFAV